MERCILLIDDDPDEFLFLTEAVKSFPDIKCHYACNTDIGIAIMAMYRPEFVMLDLNMPLVNGLESLKKIKSIQQIADIPVVLFSTHISDECYSLAYKYKADGCYIKPSSIHAFSSIIQELTTLQS